MHQKFKEMNIQIKKYLFIALGSLCVALGAIGVVVPGLPTTPFLLLASWFFYRSSERLQKKLLASWLGKYIREYESNRGLSVRGKITAIAMMLTMCSISTIFFIPSMVVKIIVACAGIIGTVVVGFVVPTTKKK